jgi:hypothetical protein
MAATASAGMKKKRPRTGGLKEQLRKGTVPSSGRSGSYARSLEVVKPNPGIGRRIFSAVM